MLKQNMPESLLFYLPGDSFDALKANGCPTPNFNSKTALIEDGPFGGAIYCEDRQRLSWWAPGNVYGERGTLAFYWRSRYQAGPTPFPIFRIAPADHSSWDCVFLRLDWNGEGFEAMVSDINLQRARVYTKLGRTLRPDEWIHLAVSWDENYGIRLYVNGERCAEEYRPAVYFTGLDQFGPHSRIISHWQVQSDYNFIRGGDVAEITIFDQMLRDEDVRSLKEGVFPDVPAYAPDFASECVKREWASRNGFDRPLKAVSDRTCIRKVEIPDAYDLKRWWWKACDGIRETTWPGVFNRSGLKGRNDYFQLPDWDCYSLSGRAITFELPDEYYNHIEISGSAHGQAQIVEEAGKQPEELFTREAGFERTAHDVKSRKGGKIRFTNDEAEEPIGDFEVLNVYEGIAPAAIREECYTVRPGIDTSCPAMQELSAFIEGRYTPYERNRQTAVPDGKDKVLYIKDEAASFPFLNIIVPYEPDASVGMDGIEIAFDVPEDGRFAIQIKDPLWYYRNLAHFLFSAEKGRKTLWFDTRDRILPEGKCLYITIAAEHRIPENIKLRVLYKPAEEAKKEHIEDRFRQLRDAYGHMTEERPLQKEYNLFNRYYGDMQDILRIDPAHVPTVYYKHDFELNRQRRRRVPTENLVKIETAKVPEGVPAWAFKQVEFLKRYKKLVNWYIDHRQIENGEFGGGLSDDGDWVATWFLLVQMDSDAEKIKEATFRNTEAFYEQGMFTNGLCSIQADELHASEEGLISLSGCLNSDFGNPKWLERAMETARQLDWITGINAAGHRHFRSAYYNGSTYATDAPWNRQLSHSFTAIGPSWQVARYNGNPHLLQLLREMADSQLAHYHADTGISCPFICFDTDEETEKGRVGGERSLMIPAWKILGDRRYYETLPESRSVTKTYEAGVEDGNDEMLPYRPFIEGTDILDKDVIARRYEGMNQIAGVREYYNTLGSPWIDRVFLVPDAVACARLGDDTGRIMRYNYPSHAISWKFSCPGDDEKVGILSPISERRHLKIIVCNISRSTVFAKLFGNEVDPGIWSVTAGLDTTGDDRADTDIKSFSQHFEWSESVELTFPPMSTTVVEMQLTKDGVPYWERCDLGVSRDDLRLYKHGLNARIHSLGAVDSEEVEVVIKNAAGEILKTQILPPIPAPEDLWPRYRDVCFNLHHIDSLEGCYLEIDPAHRLCETTRHNNTVSLSGLKVI